MPGRPTRPKPPRGSGVQADGTWVPEFEGQRKPFTTEHGGPVGNALAVKHGAYTDVRLAPRAGELADAIRPLVPGYTPSDEIAVRLLGLIVARLEKTSEVLADAAPNEYERLRADERGWVNSARRYLADLGLTPTSRARLALDLARTGGALTEIEGLDEYLERRYGSGEENGRA